MDVICASSLLLEGESDGLLLLVLVERVQRRPLVPPERDVRQLLASAHNLRADTDLWYMTSAKLLDFTAFPSPLFPLIVQGDNNAQRFHVDLIPTILAAGGPPM